MVSQHISQRWKSNGTNRRLQNKSANTRTSLRWNGAINSLLRRFCSTTCIHRDPIACAALVFKNRVLGLANFLGGKMGPFFRILIFSYPPFRLVWRPKNRGNGTGAGLTPFWRKTFLRTKSRFRPVLGGWTQFSNLFDGLEGAENLRFQGPRQIQITDNFERSSVPRELHNKTLLVRKVCWIQFTAVWYKPRVSSKTDRRALLKCDNQVFEQ